MIDKRKQVEDLVMRHYYTVTPFGIYITPARVVDAVLDVVKESVNEERARCAKVARDLALKLQADIDAALKNEHQEYWNSPQVGKTEDIPKP